MGYMCLFQFWFPQGRCLRSGIAESYGGFIPSFLRNLHIIFHSGCYQFTFPSTVPFSTPSPAFIVCRLFDDRHSDWCEVISHCSFDLHFSNNERCWAPFHVFVSHLYVFLEKCLFMSFPYFLIGLLVFLVLSSISSINGTAIMEDSMEISLKTRNKTTIWASNPTPRHIPWGNQNWNRHMYHNVHCSTIYNS